jgi:membrane-bound serine protease (ClpP class)
VTLSPSQAVPVKIKMTAVERFLFTVSDPSIALILMTLGMMGLIYEFMHPGAVLPGVVGAICFILALYSLGSLPINYAGLFLIFFSFILFFFEIKAPTHGILLVGGIISLVLGTVLLIPAGYPYFAISRGVIAGITLLTSAFFLFIAIMVTKTMMKKPVSGGEGMVGLAGIAQSDLSPEGVVMVEGERWNARSEGDTIPKGAQVRVLQLKGLKLLVKKDEGAAT